MVKYHEEQINEKETGCKMKLWAIHDIDCFRICFSCNHECENPKRNKENCQIGLKHILKYQAMKNLDEVGLFLLPDSPEMVSMFQEFGNISRHQDCNWSTAIDDIVWWFKNMKEFRS